MKNRLLFLLMVFMSLQSFAQYANSFISLRSGVSIPLKPYGSHDLGKGSFTTLGINVSAEGAWFFTTHFGVGGQVGLNLHPIDVSALARAKVSADPFLSTLTIRSDPFRVVNATMGIYTHYNIGRNLSANAKLLGGIFWANTAYQLYKPTYFLTGPDYFEITSARDCKFILEPGVGLEYRISSFFALKADVELLSRTMQFGFNTWEGVRYDRKHIGFINAVIGLVVLL